MPLTCKNKILKTDQNGFTLIELIIGSLVSLLLLGVVAGVFQSQTGIFTRELNQGAMEANGRSVVDFLSRGVQNAGYNINRGTRFLAASDHFISQAFDENDDGVIQNDEIFTYAVSNTTGASNANFTISPFFDFNDNGRVEQDETRDYLIELTLQNPPFNLYLFTPNQADNSSLRNTAARNIDNLVIRYYDKNNNALPVGVLTDNGEVDGKPIPPYTLSRTELNQVRKVEFEVMVRSKDEDANENKIKNNGVYLAGSVAVGGETGSYNDRFHRITLNAVSSPRNLTTAGFGKVSLSASPATIICPASETTVTADVVDPEGESIPDGFLVRFNSSDGVINPETANINGGEVPVTLTYDWSSASATATVSASTEVNIDGKLISVFNAIPVTFDGTFLDDFDIGPKSSWSDVESTPLNSRLWEVENGKYRLKSSGESQINLNGCTQLKGYEIVINVQKTNNHNTGDFFSLIARSQPDPSNLPEESLGYYAAEVVCDACEGAEPTGHKYLFRLVERNRQDQLVGTPLASIDLKSAEIPFTTGVNHSLKVIVLGDTLLAKFWKSSEPEPADDATEELGESGGGLEEVNGVVITFSGVEFTQGNFGLSTNTNINNFDNLVLSRVESN